MEGEDESAAWVIISNNDEVPPGFRFDPTAEEIISYYLVNKIKDTRFASLLIGDVDLNNCEPWDLPKKAKMGEKEWFFYFKKDRKYSRGKRTNRATKLGYWKATGKDKEIFKKGKKSCLIIGMKKTLVFYKGRAPKGERSNWVMHEYRLHPDFSHYNFSNTDQNLLQEEWVVCRVFHKKTRTETSDDLAAGVEVAQLECYMDHGPTLPDYCCSTPTNLATDQLDFKANIISLSKVIPNNDNINQNYNFLAAPDPLVTGPYLGPINPSPDFYRPIANYPDWAFQAADSTINFAPENYCINELAERICRTGTFSSFNEACLSPSMPELDSLWS